jgi:hemoglobin/transferrin/lactoferrin receptor protein
MSNTFLVRAAVGACIALAARGTPAATPDDLLESVTITARRTQPLSLTVSTVRIVTADELETVLANDLRDIAAYEPGVSVRSDPNRFGADGISIRGIGGNRVAIEVDGVPVSKAFTIGSFASAGRPIPDLALAERVEILRGPASALHGSDALGGIVSVATWRPRDWLAESRDGRATRISVGHDDSDRTRSVTVQSGLATTRVAGWLAFAHRDGHESELAAASVEANPRDYIERSAMLRMSIGDESKPFELGLSYDRRTQSTELLSLRGLPGRFANTTDISGDDRSDRATAFLARSFGAPDVGVGRVTLRAHSMHIDALQQTSESRRAAPPRVPSALQIEREFEFSQRLIGATMLVERNIAFATVAHRLLWGFDADHTRVAEQRDGSQLTQSTGATTNVILGEAFPLRDFPISNVRETGFFIEDEISAPNARWSFRVGARYDEYRLSPKIDSLWLEDNATLDAVRVRHGAWSPSATVTWRLAPRLRVFGQYTHGFRSPPFEDVNIGLDLPSVGVRALPNAALQPERSDGVEFGLNLQHGALYGTVSLFETHYRNLIESKVNLGRDSVTGLTIFQSQNRARARIRGIEFDLRADLADWHAALDGFSARFSASRIEGADTARDVPLNSVDPAKLTLGLRFAPYPGGPAIEARLTTVRAKSNVDQPALGSALATTRGYATTDIVAEYPLGNHGRIRGIVTNLFDRNYAVWADVRGRTVDDPLLPLYFSAGRGLSVALDWRL